MLKEIKNYINIQYKRLCCRIKALEDAGGSSVSISQDINTDTGSTTLVPSVKAVEDYVATVTPIVISNNGNYITKEDDNFIFAHYTDLENGEAGIYFTEKATGVTTRVLLANNQASLLFTNADGNTQLTANSLGVTVASNIPNSRGLIGSADFTAGIQDLDFAQKKYVDDTLAQFAIDHNL